MTNKRFLTAIYGLLLITQVARAQLCPRVVGNNDGDQWLRIARETTDPNALLRTAAIAQDQIIHMLKLRASGDSELATIPGAAQVGLARLGDEDALSALRHELNRVNNRAAVQKIARVNTSRSVAMLMTYLIDHQKDGSRILDLGDVQYDPLVEIMADLGSRVRNPPKDSQGNVSMDDGDWGRWWEANHASPNSVVVFISGNHRDPYEACLARKVEWGFPTALVDLAAAAGPSVSKELEDLNTMGDQRTATLKTFQGSAETALAKLGIPEAFDRIASELDTPNYKDAIEKLEMIGGAQSVAILVRAFDSKAFLHQYASYPKLIQRQTEKRNQLILGALLKLVANPPARSRTVEVWKKWWAKSGGDVRYVSLPPSE